MKAKYFLNIDSEEKDVFIIGCAGGEEIGATYKIEKQILKDSKNLHEFKLEVGGLAGGHSGGEIHIGKANAIKIIARLLKKISSLNKKIYLTSIQGSFSCAFLIFLVIYIKILYF